MTAGNRLKFQQSRAYESFIPLDDRGSRRRRYLSLKSIREKIDDAEVGKDQKDFNSGSKRRIRTRSFRLWSLWRNDARDNLWLGSNHLEHRRKHCQLLPSWLPDCLSIGVKPYRPCQRTFLRPWGNTSLLSKDIRYVYLTAIRFRFSMGNGYERVIIEMILARWTIFEFTRFHTDSMIWNQLKL